MRLGFDVGGTKTDAVVVTPSGEPVTRMRRATGWGSDAVVATILSLADDLLREAGLAPADVRSIGVGMPGQVRPGGTLVTHAVNLGIDALDLGRTVGRAFGAPVTAENDVKAAAVGAYALHGGGRAEAGAMAYLNLGTGIAAGFVVDGALWRGTHGTAGEVGHISVDPAGPRCRCGQRGCIEAFSGGGSIAERWGKPTALPVADVFDAADAGDPDAVVLRDGLVHGVASAVRILVLTADVASVVIGGGVSALGDRLLGRVTERLDTDAASSPFLASLHLADRLELLPTGSPAAALGAALLSAATEPRIAPPGALPGVAASGLPTPRTSEGKAVTHG